MERQFLFSLHPAARIKGCSSFHAADYYVCEGLKNEGEKDVSCGNFLFSTREEIEKSVDYINSVYGKMLSLLTANLVAIHKYGSQQFWQKAIGLHFLYFIQASYSRYTTLIQLFDPGKYSCNTIKVDNEHSYYKFSDIYFKIGHSDLGREVFFSKYIDFMYPNLSHGCFYYQESPSTKLVSHDIEETKVPSIIKLLRKANPKNITRKVLSFTQPTVGVFGNGFSSAHMQKLAIASLGKVQSLYPPEIEQNILPRNTVLREQLLRNFPEQDAFCGFIKHLLMEFFPTMYLEDFECSVSEAKEYWERFPKLHCLINENFIGYENSSFHLAVACEHKKISHFYNEHNGISHPYLGSPDMYYIKYSDKYLSSGWHASCNKVIPLASLHDWPQLTAKKTIDVLFLAAPKLAEFSYFRGDNSYCGSFNVVTMFEFHTTFFSQLPSHVRTRITYRDYFRKFLSCPVPAPLQQYVDHMPATNPQETGQSLISRSRLIICSYISTGYLEALISNTPCIIFYDRKRIFLDTAHASFFDDLIAAGIMQSCPKEAAKLLETIIDAPDTWWNLPERQEKIQAFLAKNFGDPKVLSQFILDCSKGKMPS